MKTLAEALITNKNIKDAYTGYTIKDYVFIPLGSSVRKYLDGIGVDYVEDEIGVKYIFQPEDKIKKWAKSLPDWVKRRLKAMSYKVDMYYRTPQEFIKDLAIDGWGCYSKKAKFYKLDI